MVDEIYSSLCNSIILNRLELQLLLKSYNIIFISQFYIFNVFIHTKKIYTDFLKKNCKTYIIVFDKIIISCLLDIYFEESINMQEMINLLEKQLEIN